MYGGRNEGWHVPHERITLHVLYDSYSRESMGQTMFVSYDLLSPYGMNYLHLMRTLEEQDMDGWIGEHLVYGENLSYDGVTKEKTLQHSPCSCLRSSNNFGGEECNVLN